MTVDQDPDVAEAFETLRQSGFSTDSIIAAYRDMIDNYDPTPYCSSCGAMDSSHCQCPPIAENE